MSHIETFIDRIKQTLNWRMALNEALCAMVLALTLMLIVALAFVLRGLRVEYVWYLAVLPVALVFYILRFIARYCRRDAAAVLADNYFAMHDSLRTELDFSTDSGAFHTLRRRQTESLCSRLDARELRRPLSRQMIGAGVVLLLLVGFLSMLDDSAAVQSARRRRQVIEKTTLEINNKLKKELEDFIKKLDPLQKKILDKNKLKEAFENLRKQRDLKEAMRQYGALEQRIATLGERMKLRENEQLLRKFARELLKDPVNRSMGRKLEQGKYRDAANELRKNRMDSQHPEALNNTEKLQKMLRAMQSAERARTSAPGSDALQRKIDKLSKAAREAERQRQQCDKSSGCRKKYSQSLDKMNKALEKLAEEMGRIQTRKDLQNKMSQLRRSCGRAQQQCRAACNNPGGKPGNNPGGRPRSGKGGGKGKGIGTASAGNMDNTDKTELSGGRVEAVKGNKNNRGASAVEVTDAASGHGKSRRAGKKITAEFKRQMEAFIRRDDIPVELKQGVKQYFIEIHQQKED